jgi:HlyD family secretion protein
VQVKKLSTIVVAVVVSVATIVYVRHSEGGTDEDAAAVLQAPVTTGPIVQTVRAIGTLEPLRTVQVGSQVSGTISALYVDFNSVVKKGQLLAEIDPSLLKEQVAVQQANLAKLDNDIAQQAMQLANDRLNLQRAQAEFAKGLISRQTLETAEVQVKTRAAQLESTRKMKVQGEAQLAASKLQVDYCSIRSPIDGVVVSRLVDVGQAIQARVNAPQLFVLASDLTTLRIAAAVDEADIGYIRRGMPVTFTVDAYRGERFTGRIEAVRLNAQISNSVVTYPVWIHAANDDLRLRPSMTANLLIDVASTDQAVRVPAAALTFRPKTEMFGWLGLPAPAPGQSFRPQTFAATTARGEPSSAPTAATWTSAAKIDDLFEPVPKKTFASRVWIYDPAAADPSARLRPVDVQTGLTDGEYSELIGGDLRPGVQVVTGVVPPAKVLKAQQNPLLPGRRRGGMVQMGAAPLPTLRRGR